MNEKVTLVIPNFNGSQNIDSLIPRVIEENFDAVFVVDDCSTDSSLELLNAYSGEVSVLAGDKNLGAGGNRNRILNVVTEGIIMFLDIDTELITEGVVTKAREIFKDEEVALVGGLLLDRSGVPMSWNFGPEMHPFEDAQALVYENMANDFSNNQEVLDYIYQHAMPYSDSWSVFNKDPIEREVDWVAEGNFCIRASVFTELSGFDQNMRYHEAHDIGKRVRALGYKVKFSPEIVAKHLEIEVRGQSREIDFKKAQQYFYKKHWGMSENVFDGLFRSGSETS